MKVFGKRILSFVLATCMAASTINVIAGAATVDQFTDFPDDWSTKALTTAVENGLLHGYEDNTIRAKGLLTRAEMVTIVNNAFGAVIEADISDCKDMDSDKWYYHQIAKGVNMGIIYGCDEGNMMPERAITREEAFAMITRALVLSDGDTTSLDKFIDKNDISDWAVDSLASLAEKGYINGDDESRMNPKSNITRAEFAVLMDNIVKHYYSEKGTYNGNVEGNVMVNAGGVTLSNMVINGDLIIGDGVDKGTFELKNVTVKGRILVRGGQKPGEIKFTKTAVGDKVIVNNVNGTVYFDNYKTEAPFKNLVENTPAEFKKRQADGGYGGGSPTRFAVTFDTNGGEPMPAIVVDQGTRVDLELQNYIPKKTGYTFDGWYLNGTKVTEVIVNTNITLVAKWAAKLTFDTNGGKLLASDGVDEIEYIVFDLGTTVSLGEYVPTKEGTEFDKWLYEGAEVTEITMDMNKTIVAQWKDGSESEEYYTVKFVDNGITEEYLVEKDKKLSTAVHKESGDKLQAMPRAVQLNTQSNDSNNPYSNEVEQYGWYNSTDANKVKFELNTTITSDVTLYPGWMEASVNLKTTRVNMPAVYLGVFYNPDGELLDAVTDAVFMNRGYIIQGLEEAEKIAVDRDWFNNPFIKTFMTYPEKQVNVFKMNIALGDLFETTQEIRDLFQPQIDEALQSVPELVRDDVENQMYKALDDIVLNGSLDLTSNDKIYPELSLKQLFGGEAGLRDIIEQGINDALAGVPENIKQKVRPEFDEAINYIVSGEKVPALEMKARNVNINLTLQDLFGNSNGLYQEMKSVIDTEIDKINYNNIEQEVRNQVYPVLKTLSEKTEWNMDEQYSKLKDFTVTVHPAYLFNAQVKTDAIKTINDEIAKFNGQATIDPNFSAEDFVSDMLGENTLTWDYNNSKYNAIPVSAKMYIRDAFTNGAAGLASEIKQAIKSEISMLTTESQNNIYTAIDNISDNDLWKIGDVEGLANIYFTESIDSVIPVNDQFRTYLETAALTNNDARAFKEAIESESDFRVTESNKQYVEEFRNAIEGIDFKGYLEANKDNLATELENARDYIGNDTLIEEEMGDARDAYVQAINFAIDNIGATTDSNGDGLQDDYIATKLTEVHVLDVTAEFLKKLKDEIINVNYNKVKDNEKVKKIVEAVGVPAMKEAIEGTDGAIAIYQQKLQNVPAKGISSELELNVKFNLNEVFLKRMQTELTSKRSKYTEVVDESLRRFIPQSKYEGLIDEYLLNINSALGTAHVPVILNRKVVTEEVNVTEILLEEMESHIRTLQYSTLGIPASIKNYFKYGELEAAFEPARDGFANKIKDVIDYHNANPALPSKSLKNNVEFNLLLDVNRYVVQGFADKLKNLEYDDIDDKIDDSIFNLVDEQYLREQFNIAKPKMVSKIDTALLGNEISGEAFYLSLELDTYQLLLEKVDETLDKINFNTIKDKIPSQIRMVVGDEVLDRQISKVLNDFKARIKNAATDDTVTTLDCMLRISINLVDEIIKPEYDRYVEELKDRLGADYKGVLKDIVEVMSPDNLFDVDTSIDAPSGYKFRSYQDYYNIFEKLTLLGNEAIVELSKKANNINDFEGLVSKYVDMGYDVYYKVLPYVEKAIDKSGRSFDLDKITNQLEDKKASAKKAIVEIVNNPDMTVRQAVEKGLDVANKNIYWEEYEKTISKAQETVTIRNTVKVFD